MKNLLLFLSFVMSLGCQPNEIHKNIKDKPTQTEIFLMLSNKKNIQEDKISKAFYIAMGDIFSNLRPYKGKLQKEEITSIFAGLDYSRPWTRDASINIWNGLGLILPETSKNTLISVLETNSKGDTIIGGQYWDRIIWGIGAWNYYLFTGDKDFIEIAYRIIKKTIKIQEEEFDNDLNLFRGAAVYGDGVSAYDKKYADNWTEENSI